MVPWSIKRVADLPLNAKLAGCQSSILSSNEWHNDMNPAFISTIMAPNFKIEEITYITPAFSGIPNRGQIQKGLHHP